MMEPVWLSVHDVIHLHHKVIEGYGGSAGIRDRNLIESALARPLQLWAYGDPQPDMAALAASLAHGLAKNHGFVDGNKRVAAISLMVFLRANGYRIETSSEDGEAIFVALAAGEIDADILAGWIREKAVAVD